MDRKNLLVSSALLLFIACTACAQTQIAEHGFEIGGHYTAIRLKTFDATVNGLGARLGYNFNRRFALDAEANFFPETHLGNEQVGQKTQAFIGVKAGARSKYVGVFAKARPGVMFIGELTSGFNCRRGVGFTSCRPQHNNFALDVGGIVEFYPSTRTIVRLDAGDTIIRERQTTLSFFGRPPLTTTDTTHNFQVSVGFSYRF